MRSFFLRHIKGVYTSLTLTSKCNKHLKRKGYEPYQVK